MFSMLKSAVLPSGTKPRRVVAGLNRGVAMRLDLHHDLQRLFGSYEREIAAIVERCGRGIQCAIDVGANDGYYTLYFLAKTSARMVLSFEPSSQARRALLANLHLNGLDRDPRFLLSPLSVGAHEGKGITSLDSMSDAIQTPCLIKVDVEGAEADVVAGAENLIRQPFVFLLIETHSRALENQCHSTLRKAGYETVVVGNAWWRRILPERRLLSHNQWLFAWKDQPPGMSQVNALS